MRQLLACPAHNFSLATCFQRRILFSSTILSSHPYHPLRHNQHTPSESAWHGPSSYAFSAPLCSAPTPQYIFITQHPNTAASPVKVGHCYSLVRGFRSRKRQPNRVLGMSMHLASPGSEATVLDQHHSDDGDWKESFRWWEHVLFSCGTERGVFGSQCCGKGI